MPLHGVTLLVPQREIVCRILQEVNRNVKQIVPQVPRFGLKPLKASRVGGSHTAARQFQPTAPTNCIPQRLNYEGWL